MTMKTFIKAFAASRRGSIAVETALGIALFFGVMVLIADMHEVGIERARLEAAAGQIAQNAAVQSKITQPGLDILVDAALQTKGRDAEVIIMNVLQSGAIEWMLRRGDGAALCELNVDGKYFTGTLPVDPPEAAGEGSDDEDEDGRTMSMIVVDVCRRTAGLELGKHVKLPRVMQVENIYRASTRTVKIDEALEDENLMPSGDEDEDK